MIGATQPMRLEGRQQTDAEGRETHDDDGDEEGVLAADQVADAAEDQRAEGPDEEAGGVGREGRQEGRGLVPLREEERGEERRQGRVEVEVVPLEDRSDR